MAYRSDPRVLFAAERTLLAWQRSGIALMGFGFVVERFGLFLQVVARTPASSLHRGFTLWIGVVLLLLGVAANVIAIIQFRRVAQGLGADEIPLGYWTDAGSWMSVALTGVALALIAYFVVSS
jgi:putative membrane protein